MDDVKCTATLSHSTWIFQVKVGDVLAVVRTINRNTFQVQVNCFNNYPIISKLFPGFLAEEHCAADYLFIAHCFEAGLLTI